MTVTISSFRGAFPEFASATTYPDAEITFWLDLATKLTNAARWGNLADYGQQLFVAHNLCLDFNAKQASASGGNPGMVISPQTSGSVDKVSYSRNPGLVMDPKNGHWNLTIYGLRYIRMIRIVGAGPVQIGLPMNTGSPEDGAFAGPWGSIVPNPSN